MHQSNISFNYVYECVSVREYVQMHVSTAGARRECVISLDLNVQVVVSAKD